PASVYLLQSAMQEVMQDGTARAASYAMPGYRLAGKTGTTDDMGDFWFAGFGGDLSGGGRVGRGDNAPVGWGGAGGALKPWISFMRGASHVPLDGEAPAGVQMAWIDTATGLLSAEGCGGVRQFPFIAGSVPTETAPCSGLGAIPKFFENLFR